MELPETLFRLSTPLWEIIRGFRDRAGFHADKPRAFFRARHEVIAHHKKVAEALEDFRRLFATILKAESTELPDLSKAVDEFLDEMESDHHVKYDRAEFKRYLILP